MLIGVVSPSAAVRTASRESSTVGSAWAAAPGAAAVDPTSASVRVSAQREPRPNRLM